MEKLNEISWAGLQHAYGSAADVPGLLRGLLSEDREARWEAISGLFERLCHQGTVYEASSRAVHFLQEMLSAPGTQDKSMIADLLAAMSDGYGSLDAALQDSEMEQIYREALSKEGRDFDQELLHSRQDVQATRDAVGAQLPLLFPYLAHDEPAIRHSIAAALKHYPSQSSLTLPLLRQALASETDEEVREVMEATIAVLKEQNSL